MKQPTPLWQVISICAIVLIAAFSGIISESNRVATLQSELDDMKIQQMQIQTNSDKRFDKMDSKIDAIQLDTRQILVNLANKEDRK